LPPYSEVREHPSSTISTLRPPSVPTMSKAPASDVLPQNFSWETQTLRPEQSLASGSSAFYIMPPPAEPRASSNPTK
jgi:hypothetical protein